MYKTKDVHHLVYARETPKRFREKPKPWAALNQVQLETYTREVSLDHQAASLNSLDHTTPWTWSNECSAGPKPYRWVSYLTDRTSSHLKENDSSLQKAEQALNMKLHRTKAPISKDSWMRLSRNTQVSAEARIMLPFHNALTVELESKYHRNRDGIKKFIYRLTTGNALQKYRMFHHRRLAFISNMGQGQVVP